MKAPVRRPRFGLPLPVLMLITDRHLAGSQEALVSAVTEAVEGGVNSVQLREKDLSLADLLSLAVRLREVIGERAMLVVNGSLDVALASGADGVHLPEAAPMIERPRRPFVIGRSVHSREAAELAWAECSDYVIAGPVYKTGSHPGMEPGGLALIEEITSAVALPVLAVGGVTADRVEEVMRAGSSGIAVISAILGRQAGQAAQALRERVDSAWSRVQRLGL
jgi:thiamine-phosphate diphosphorylase